MFREETIKYFQDNNKNIENEFIEVGNEFFYVYMQAFNVIMDGVLALKPSRYDANSYVILSIRNIEVLIDGMQCLFNKKNTEASQVLLRSLCEVSIQLIYFIYKPKLIEENYAIYQLCHARDLEEELDSTYKEYNNDDIKKEILKIREKYSNNNDEIQEILNKNKFASWYSVAGMLRKQNIKSFYGLCKFLKLEGDKTKSVLYDTIYNLTSSYIHGKSMANMVYKIDDKLMFLPIRYLRSSSFYLTALYYIMNLLLPKLIYYCESQNISLIDLCGDDLNMQKERIEKIREVDQSLI